MLMNVQDIRESNWLQYMISAYQKYRYNITWGDQDLINIFFNEYPGKVWPLIISGGLICNSIYIYTGEIKCGE